MPDTLIGLRYPITAWDLVQVFGSGLKYFPPVPMK